MIEHVWPQATPFGDIDTNRPGSLRRHSRAHACFGHKTASRIMSRGGIVKKFSSGCFDQYTRRFVHPFGMSPLNVAAHPSHAHMEPEISAIGIVFTSTTFVLRRACRFIAITSVGVSEQAASSGLGLLNAPQNAVRSLSHLLIGPWELPCDWLRPVPSMQSM